jgi:pimeloyl-ACP methyl ester carboxylesterase
MATFVLVHGTWQGAWCWRDILSLLESQGHQAMALDLPGHGADQTPLEQVTLQHYIDAVVLAVDSLHNRPILVVHSMGGLITAVAQASPDAIAALVYVAGLIPPNGLPMMNVVEQYDPAFPASFVWSADGRTAGITPDGAREFLYGLCPARAIEDAIPRFTPEPVAPFEAPVTTTEERFGRVPRYYVETLQDRAVPLTLQRAIQARVGFKKVFPLNADHSPFFSAPAELVSCLNAIAVDLEKGL